MIKKFVTLLFISIALTNCEDIPSGVIEPQTIDYRVIKINAPEVFTLSESNKIMESSILIENVETVKRVWGELHTLNGLERISSFDATLNDESGSTRTYIGQLEFDEQQLSGFYQLIFFVEDNIGIEGENLKKVGTKQFRLLSEADNLPPEISDLVIPDEVDRNVQFSFSLSVTDPNGLNDIASVFYQLFDPDGNLLSNSQGISEFPLFDNGDTEGNSDIAAGDGIYSVFLTFPSTVVTGDWEFIFNAVDLQGLESNTITHIIKVN